MTSNSPRPLVANQSVRPYAWMLPILGLAAAYFVTGKFGTFLAIPPGYATAIWPPSGIALAGILLYGYRVWPGILIGSFLVNIATTLTAASSDLIASLIITATISSGASLQAVVGGYLVRRFANYPNLLSTEKDVFLFFIFGGLLSALVNSIIAVSTLTVSHRIPNANFMVNWGTWWMGDVLGILIFTPLILVWAIRPSKLWHKRQWIISLPIMVMFILTTVAVFYESNHERKRFKLEFNQQAAEMTGALKKSFISHLNVLRSLDSFYLSSKTIDRGEFLTFVTYSLGTFQGIQAMEWTPIVRSAEREAFELRIRQEGYPTFQITERNSHNQLVRAENHPEYAPVTYLEPYKGNEGAFGYDLYSQAVRREAMDRARDTGEIAVTARITLVQEKGNQSGVLAFMPIYRKDHPRQTLEERRSNITGYVLAVFRGEDIVTEALKELNLQGLSYRLIDENRNAPEGEQIIFSSDQKDAPPLVLQEKGLFGRNFSLMSSSSIPVGGRHWRFEVVPTQEYLSFHRTDNAWLILIVGLILTSMVGAYVMVSSGRASLLRRLVDERTKSLAQSEERFRSTFEAAPIGVTNSSLDGYFVEVNRGYCEFVGYTHDELLNITYRQVTAPEYRQLDAEMTSKTLAGEISGFNHEKQYLRKTGERVWGHLSVKLIRDAGGLPDHFIGVVENIDRRKQAEASARKLLLAVEQSPISVVITDLDANIEYVNEAFVLRSGYSRDEVIGQNPRFMKSGKTPKETLTDLWATITRGDVWKGELINKRKDGVEFLESALITPIRELDGSVTHYLGIKEDITERKKSEEANRELLNRINQIANSVPGVIYQYKLRPDGSSCFPFASEAMREIYRVAPEDVREDASAVLAILHPEDYDSVIASIRQSAVTLEPWQQEYRVRFSEGTVRWLYGNAIPIREADGAVLWHGFISDITERKRTQQALQRESEKTIALLHNASDGIHILDYDGNIIEASDSFCTMLGYDRKEVIGMHVSQWDANFIGDELIQSVRRQFEQKVRVQFETRHRRKDGTIFDAEVSGFPLELDGKPVVFNSSRDITERKLSEQALQIAATVFESQEGMLVTDADNLILRVNRAFTRITGYSPEEVIGKNPRILQSGRQDAGFYSVMWSFILRTGSWEGEIWNRRKNGDVYPEHLTITAVKDRNGVVTNYVATLTDITVSKAVADEIERLAYFDPLTGLPNRRLLLDRLKPAMASSQRSGRKGGVLFIDMDNFKMLNDTLGHDIGDLLLQQVAHRLQSCVRDSDTVARLGGDEFVIMLEDLSEHIFEAANQIEVIGHKILTTLNESYVLATHDYHSTPSIGATLFHGNEHSLEEPLKQADIAMYQAKASGRNALRFFDPQMQASITARVALERDLQLALAENQFCLYYQPQVHRNQQISRAEVLIRWHHPIRGLVPPANFIPLAEETGLILPIGQWVLETVCNQIKCWEGFMHTQSLQLAVNVSVRQFRQTDFVEKVSQILSRSEINPNQLLLELTESLVIDDIDDTIKKMQALRKIGVRFSMDDFGTGYSSLSSLKKLPLDQLKIDQSFVRDILSDPDDAVIVQTIVAMANNLGMEVIAEGVETEAQRKFLEKLGCPLCQGYLFSKPVPIDDFEQFLKTRIKSILLLQPLL